MRTVKIFSHKSNLIYQLYITMKIIWDWKVIDKYLTVKAKENELIPQSKQYIKLNK
ncbi:unnamed protein product [Paramecium sonneborni]|uniref:Uncharacterized protein n=1 Tax=Paramecium sonneborni TaxID=65129 RepID=A0A8S1PYX1_9CILI|nr:unnamed protein product [Paramecium sonneborni]